MGAQPAVQPAGYWIFSPAQQTQPHEFSYFPSDDHHAELTMRCANGSGWISIEFSANAIDELEAVRIGSVGLSVPATYDDDPHWDQDSVTVTIPAAHRLFFELERGEPVSVEGVVYPQITETDRAHARSFVRACNGHVFAQEAAAEERTWLVVVASHPAGIVGMRAARAQVARLEDSNSCVEIWRAATSGQHAVVVSSPLTRMEASTAASEARNRGTPDAYAARANDWTRVRSGVC